MRHGRAGGPATPASRLRAFSPAAVGIEPRRDLVGVEAHEVSPLDDRHPPLSDEAANMALLDAEKFREHGDRQKVRKPLYALVVTLSPLGSVMTVHASGDARVGNRKRKRTGAAVTRSERSKRRRPLAST